MKNSVRNMALSGFMASALLLSATSVDAATLPSAPTNVTATAGNGSATVTFTPGSIGSGTLITYWAACGVDTTHLIKATGSSSPITVTGLTNGTVYYCWALTESTVGYSSNWSTVSNTVTPTSATSILPSAPTNVTATAGDGSATVTFTPGSIGSGTLVDYWAACDTVGDTVIGNSLYGHAVSLPITVTGLTNGTAYSCGGLTRSTVGDSAWSARANPVTPTATTASVPASGTAVEFYNAGINHYFMTASPEEAVALDNKPSWGWVRTCKTFDIWLTQASAPGNASPVCRFFGVFSNGTVGSHFYTVDATECDMVKGRLDWGWGYENDAFYAVKPTGSTCTGGTSPVYRVFNNGMGGAPNHRYMTSQTDVDTMVSQGWVSEGVAMCAASGTSSGGTTSCGPTTLQKELANFNTAIDGAVVDLVNMTKTVQNLETALQGDVNSASQSAVIGTLVDEFESRTTSLLANVVKMEQAESGIQQFTQNQTSNLAVTPPAVGARARSLLANNWKTQAELEIQPFAEIRNRKPAVGPAVVILGALVIKGYLIFAQKMKGYSDELTPAKEELQQANVDVANEVKGADARRDAVIKKINNIKDNTSQEFLTKVASDIILAPAKAVSTTAVVIKNAAGDFIQGGLKVISSTKECATDYKDPKCTIGVSTTDNKYPAIVPSGKTTVIVGGGNVSRTVIEEQEFPPGETVEITREEIPVTEATPEAIVQNDGGVPVTGGGTPVVPTSLTLSKVVSSQDSTSITYTVSAAVAGVTAPTSVSISVQNAGTGDSTKTISGDGTVSWSVTVLQKDATVTVTRQDTGEQQTLTLPGKTFDGYYVGVAIATFKAEYSWCLDSSEVGVSVSGSVLGGSVTGTLSGNVISGTHLAYGLTFSGTINGTVMSGTWRDPEGACSGTFSLTKQ